MRAIVIHETGGPEVLKVEEIDRPEPGEGEVLVRVAAAAVNPVDWKYRQSRASGSLPMVLGKDLSGTVEASRADGFAAGDEVFGLSASGGYAEYSTADADGTAKRPEGVSHEQAAAVTTSGLTAWQALFDTGGLTEGQTVVVAGAPGGVGHLAVQFAKVAGARVIATGSSDNRDFVLGLGADEYVDYAERDVGETVSGADVAFDTVGGPVTASLLSTLREGGVLVTIAAEAPKEAAAELGVRAELMLMDTGAKELARIGEHMAAGMVRVEIAETYPLADAAAAQERSEAGHVRGKLVLAVE